MEDGAIGGFIVGPEGLFLRHWGQLDLEGLCLKGTWRNSSANFVIFLLLGISHQRKVVKREIWLQEKILPPGTDKWQFSRNNAQVVYVEFCVHPLTVCTVGLISLTGCNLQGLVVGEE
jgi:hypothetical protein